MKNKIFLLNMYAPAQIFFFTFANSKYFAISHRQDAACAAATNYRCIV